MKYGLPGLVAVSLLIVTMTPAVAHHSFASEFDSTKPISLEGLVTKVEWMNPHVWFYLDVTDPETGEVTNWGFEMGAPHQLQRRGWSRETIELGDQLSVSGSMSRDGSPRVNAREVRTEDGTVLGAASSGGQTLGSSN
jgi:hypothetical protein